MKKWKAFIVCLVVLIVLGGTYLNALVRHPDYNPFFVIEEFRHLRSITTLESLDHEISDIFKGSALYPANKRALLGVVSKRKPKLAQALTGIPFIYESHGDSYLLFWTAGEPHNARRVFLVRNGDYFFTLSGFVEKGMLPTYRNRMTTIYHAGGTRDDRQQ